MCIVRQSDGDPGYMSRKIKSFERINSIQETNGNFDSCKTCKRLGTSRLQELHESKFQRVSRIKFIRSKPSNCSAHVSGVGVGTDRQIQRDHRTAETGMVLYTQLIFSFASVSL